MANEVILASLLLATGAMGYFFGYLGRNTVPVSPLNERRSSLDHGELTVEPSVSSTLKKAGDKDFSGSDHSEWGITIGEEVISELELAKNDLLPLTVQEIREKLGAALLSDNLVARNQMIADMLARLTPENVTAALSVFENTPRAFHTDNNFRLFMHAWGKVDGKAAFDYIKNNPDAHNVGDSHVWAMSGWTQSDPQAAFDYVTSMEKPDHGLYHGLVRGWGRIDLNGAHDFVANLKDDRLKSSLVGVIGESVVEQHGVEGALDWTTQTARESNDPRFAGAALDDVLKRAVNQDPSQAANWISNNKDHPHLKSWMFENTAGRMADRNPREAAIWLGRNMDDKRVTGRVVGRVANEWAEREPAAAAEWVDTMRGTKVFDKELAERLVGYWARQDSSAALNWAETLEPNLRRPALGRIVDSMPQEQLVSVSEWIRNAPSDSTMAAPERRMPIVRCTRTLMRLLSRH